MSDIKLLEEIMLSVESAAYLNQKIANKKLRSYVDTVLRDAYDIIQIEVASYLDDVPYV
tara:strand:- start:1613 stop:1789 length:177 start_codon:yes stop_codon:yes gene_type:complete